MGADDETCCSVVENVVYTRWGARDCPEGTTKLYEGFMAGKSHGSWGGGYNYLCMHNKPQYPNGFSNGNQNGNLLYGTEYESTGVLVKNVNGDAACAVCEHSTASIVYTQWGRRNCSNGHRTEYEGLIMSTYYTQYKSENICIDIVRDSHAASNSGNNGQGQLYVSEIEGGASDEKMYPHDRELACAVCSPRKNVAVFTRWGGRQCPEQSAKLYEGFMANSNAGHRGGGANYICLHNIPEWPEGYHKSSQNGNLIYGVEYLNTGVIDKSHGGDAACVVCQSYKAKSTYVQWGRNWCSHKHFTQYTGVVMSTHYTQYKATNLCVDVNWQTHPLSNSGNQGGGYLYTTEMEGGSSDENLYPHDREVACAVCSPIRPTAVYSRWGSRSCPKGTTKLYEGFMASSHSGHRGGGSNVLCMHSSPQYPKGYSNGSQQGNLLYGTEYENTGALDKNNNGDAACAVCEHDTASNVYVQWGRTSCSDGHKTEYSGLIMGGYYTQYNAENICVDLEMAVHRVSSTSSNDGFRMYTTEMEGGSSDETQYPHDREVACAVCSPVVRVYPCTTIAGDRKTKVTDPNKCGENGKNGETCTFGCDVGYAPSGSTKYTCNGETGQWEKGNMVCKPSIKCGQYKCKAGFKKANIDDTMGADDETCCEVVRQAIFTL